MPWTGTICTCTSSGKYVDLVITFTEAELPLVSDILCKQNNYFNYVYSMLLYIIYV